MQSRKTTARLMLGASLAALAVSALPTAGFAQATTPAGGDTAVQDVIVVGARLAERSAIDRKKNAATAVDSIVADDVGQFPDKSASEAIARIAGVALDITDSGETSGFTIRGQAADLIRVEVDGMTTLDNTGGQGGRSAQLNELSSDLIKSVDVIKGQTADMVSGGVGGTVRIEQRNGLDFRKPLIRLNLQAQTSNLNDEWTPRVNFVLGRQFFDGRLGVLINATYDKAETTQDFARVNQGATGYLPLGDWDQVDERTFVTPYDPVAAAVTTRAGCAALPTTGINSRLNCYAQFEDYAPTFVRYGRGYREDSKTSYQIRLDYRFSDNLKVFASYNPNLRKFKSKDFNYQITGATGSTNAAGARTTNYRALDVNDNHYVTSYAFVRPGLTVAQGAPGVDGQPTITNLSQTSQIRDINRDQDQKYYQIGADFEVDGWVGEFRAQHGESYVDREDFVFNPSALLDYATYSMIPGSGLWTTEAVPVAGLDLTDPAAWSTFVIPTTGATAGVSNQVDLQYPDPRVDQNSETAIQLDMTRNFDGNAGIFTRFKFGIRANELQNETWREGGLNLGNGVVLSRARSIDRLRVCTDAAVQNNLCVLGSVPLNNVTPTTTTQDQLYKLHSLTPAQYQAILDASIIDLPGKEFFGGIDDGAGLPTGWTTFDTEKVYSMLDEYLDLSDWNRNCLFECTANDGNVYKRPSFATSEKIIAAYAMLDFESEIFGMELQGNVGVRIQRNEVDGQVVRNVFDRVLVQQGSGASATYELESTQVLTEEIKVNRTSQDALPSLNLALWPIEDELVLRYSIAEQRARPPLDRLTGTSAVSCFNVDESQRPFIENLVATNPGAIIDDNANTDDAAEAENLLNSFYDVCTGRIGNPSLVGYGALTQNLSLEWYPNRDTQVSLSAFQIDVKTGRPENAADPLYEIAGNFYDVDTYDDGDGGIKNTGYEFAVKTAFSFLPSILRHTGGGFNASKVKTSGAEGLAFDRLTGKALPPRSESSYYYNANLWYDDGRINARIAYQARDIYFIRLQADGANRVPSESVAGINGNGDVIGTNTTTYFKHANPQFRSKTNSLDARASFKLNEKIQFFVEGKNLLDNTQYNHTTDEYRQIEEGTEYRWDTTYVGRRYYVGLTYTF